MVFGARFLLGRLSRVPALKKMAGLWYLLIFRLFPVIRTLDVWFQRRLVPMMETKNSFCCMMSLRSGNCKGQQKEDNKAISIGF